MGLSLNIYNNTYVVAAILFRVTFRLGVNCFLLLAAAAAGEELLPPRDKSLGTLKLCRRGGRAISVLMDALTFLPSLLVPMV